MNCFGIAFKCGWYFVFWINVSVFFILPSRFLHKYFLVAHKMRDNKIQRVQHQVPWKIKQSFARFVRWTTTRENTKCHLLSARGKDERKENPNDLKLAIVVLFWDRKKEHTRLIASLFRIEVKPKHKSMLSKPRLWIVILCDGDIYFFFLWFTNLFSLSLSFFCCCAPESIAFRGCILWFFKIDYNNLLFRKHKSDGKDQYSVWIKKCNWLCAFYLFLF